MTNFTKFEDFNNLYTLSKTLRFELKPVGNTLEHIEKKGLLDADKKRADDYKKVKKLIDLYHKNLLKKFLEVLVLNMRIMARKILFKNFMNYISKLQEMINKKQLSEKSKNLFANKYLAHSKMIKHLQL